MLRAVGISKGLLGHCVTFHFQLPTWPCQFLLAFIALACNLKRLPAHVIWFGFGDVLLSLFANLPSLHDGRGLKQNTGGWYEGNFYGIL